MCGLFAGQTFLTGETEQRPVWPEGKEKKPDGAGHCASPFGAQDAYLFKNFIGVELIYNVLVSGVPKSESVIHIHISTLFFFFKILFPHRPLQSIE